MLMYLQRASVSAFGTKTDFTDTSHLSLVLLTHSKPVRAIFQKANPL